MWEHGAALQNAEVSLMLTGLSSTCGDQVPGAWAWPNEQFC